MEASDKWSRGEVLLTCALVVIFALIWAKWPEVKVSSRTLEKYDVSNPQSPAWMNGIGLTVTARSLNDPATLDSDFEEYRSLANKYLAFVVQVDIQGANYPTMIDLPYERMSLTDASGRPLHLVNQELAANTKDPKFKLVLEKFDWSIVNNTYSREARKEKGLLLFETPVGEADALVLHLNVYHHPYKQINVAFPFSRLKTKPQSSPDKSAKSN